MTLRRLRYTLLEPRDGTGTRERAVLCGRHALQTMRRPSGGRVVMLRAAIVAFVLSLLTLALSLTTAVSMLTN